MMTVSKTDNLTTQCCFVLQNLKDGYIHHNMRDKARNKAKFKDG